MEQETLKIQVKRINGVEKILYKFKRRIICYITCGGNGYLVSTGKPSDSTCITRHYDNLDSAKKTAEEYFYNYISIF